MMQRFRLQPTHWFSGALLLILALALYRPGGTGPLPRTPSPAFRTVIIYHVVGDSDDQWLEPLRRNLAAQSELMAGTLNLMGKLPTSESPLPPGARAISVTLQGEGVALADFNGAFVSNFPGGSLRESLIINAVLKTLAQFPGVKAVQFTVDGKIIDTLGGHVDLSEPQEVPELTV